MDVLLINMKISFNSTEDVLLNNIRLKLLIFHSLCSRAREYAINFELHSRRDREISQLPVTHFLKENCKTY